MSDEKDFGYSEEDDDGDDYGSAFEQDYPCYPVSITGRPHLEKGDKILMPPSALSRLADLEMNYPMLFELSNPSEGRTSHCGVLEFTAKEGMVYLPNWMMENMALREGSFVHVRSVSLPKGTYLKLQPHTEAFLNISNPKAILETTFRCHSCLTKGDTIVIDYNDKRFYVDIVETKPSNAICIIDTDCEVDFAPPLDYKEPERPVRPNLSNNTPPEEVVKEVPKFTPFTGTANRLDGMSVVMNTDGPVSSPTIRQHQAEATNGTNGPTSRRRSGKLVFGSNVDQAPNGTPKATAKERNEEPTQKVEEPKFQAFTGKKYSLLG